MRARPDPAPEPAGSRGSAPDDRRPALTDGRGHAERLRDAVVRQGGRCFWCGRPFSDLVAPTTDHVVPRVKGGPSWPENEVAACRRCNAERGHTTPVDWLEECVRRGWPADPSALDATLATLETAIVRRGGQRRARPYVHSQRRRLSRSGPGQERST
ncbi:HNH endonuclease [Cellulomonas aerilata]|uniref:HNH nuclease domain-containing protein n=1 Tax=Cellulomonas aerilata TaxID=515326 RepID=A0A512DG88_9CELL|nr:HNH endonuclease [Cellulomonas aerilata]GEO35452.1 hypothetical protein CAE01nite_31770 [Cellulomonas aerilata]